MFVIIEENKRQTRTMVERYKKRIKKLGACLGVMMMLVGDVSVWLGFQASTFIP